MQSGSIELTHGTIDRLIGKVAFPVIRRLARPFGNFVLARLLVFIGLSGSVLWSVFLHESILNLLVQVVSDVIGGAFLFAWFIRRMEIAANKMTGDVLPIELVMASRGCSWLRKFYLGAALFVLCVAGPSMVILETVVTNSFLTLALYAATCIVPRQSIKALEKAKASLSEIYTRVLSPISAT